MYSGSENVINRKFPLQDIQYHGTTTISFECSDGIIVAVDSRASMGDYVGSRTVKKVFPISKHIVATMAGGAADCAFWIRRIARQTKLIENDFMSTLPVSAVAKLLAATLREYKGSGLSVGTMVVGMDGAKPSLYYVDAEGTCLQGKLFCVGSGASLAYGVLDSHNLASLDISEAIDVATWAIRHATYRDGYSGGYINILHVNASGCHHVRRIDSRSKDLAIGLGL